MANTPSRRHEPAKARARPLSTSAPAVVANVNVTSRSGSLATSAGFSVDRPPTSPLTPTMAFADLELGQVPEMAPLPSSAVDTLPTVPLNQNRCDDAQTRPNTDFPTPKSVYQPSCPPPPPYSSTASVSDAQTAARHPPEPQQSSTTPHPPAPVPFPESENTDVIAVKAVMSILAIQREKAERDIRTLVKLRSMAVQDPSGFSATLQQRANEKMAAARAQKRQKGRGQSNSHPGDFLKNTFRGWDDGTPSSSPSSSSSPPQSDTPSSSPFPEIPEPQNIAHCPSVNWSKYAIVGSPLSKMHAEQLTRPIQGEPMTLVTPQPQLQAQPSTPAPISSRKSGRPSITASRNPVLPMVATTQPNTPIPNSTVASTATPSIPGTTTSSVSTNTATPDIPSAPTAPGTIPSHPSSSSSPSTGPSQTPTPNTTAPQTYVPLSAVNPNLIPPELRQEFDYYGRAPEHLIAAPCDPFEAHERARVGMRPGGWQIPVPPPVGTGVRETRRTTRRSLQHH